MRRGRARRIFLWLLAVVLGLPLLAGATAYIWWSRSLPQLDGEIPLKGLQAEVRVIRDKHGVPHIFAKDLNDAARALGYLHAQDRFFQMDITRRVTEGRLAEIIGSRGLPVDKLFRALDFNGRGAASFAALSPELKAYFRAYADGVNAWLESSGQALPLEYTVLGMSPEPWRPEELGRLGQDHGLEAEFELAAGRHPGHARGALWSGSCRASVSAALARMAGDAEAGDPAGTGARRGVVLAARRTEARRER